MTTTHSRLVDKSGTLRPGDTVAEFVDTTKRFGKVVAADRLNLSIKRGEFLSFLGPSGCGKTTALRMLAGFESPTEGQILIDGMEVGNLPAYRRPVNMVFQHYALFPHMTVAQNIGYGLRQRRPRLSRSEISEKVSRVLATVRLDGYEDRRIWQMSGGQQQRVALARAIVNEPKLLLLDEPMAALDAKLRGEMQMELLDLQRSLGITFVLVTHDQEEALSMSDRICIMGAGQIAQIGTPQELYDFPESRYVASFVGKANILPASLISSSDGLARVALAEGTEVLARVRGLPAKDAVEVVIRPESLSIATKGSPLPEDGTALPARITHRTFLGDHAEYVLDAGPVGNLQVKMSRQTSGLPINFNVGEDVDVSWRASEALVLAED
ncbi:ABC transporter ATP-binding protein [Qingshengfaniella alkalisoli]|uniref:Spermidine/putrescine import ATP-binding protein PotA n=1 Tax=Qingshengfaniella alkalisoli TaxID=2599296 RepID=A0A5B8J103_9RHOB|nr:ABC transporter ATP-binding protein [Qingshengfaniella alkalisoli]QDY70558.1 ABC transporter ATP-binding protein [Qingshengfaniella alkalisoli]